MKNRKETGYFGEAIACSELETRGYVPLAKNYLIHGGEIDLIMRRRNELVFVEVKTRRNSNYGGPLESITPLKERRMRRAAAVYLCGKDKYDYDIRFFAVSVLLDYRDVILDVEVIEDIFAQ